MESESLSIFRIIFHLCLELQRGKIEIGSNIIFYFYLYTLTGTFAVYYFVQSDLNVSYGVCSRATGFLFMARENTTSFKLEAILIQAQSAKQMAVQTSM